MSKRRTPKDAPAGAARVWEEKVDGYGTFYFLGSVVRDGKRTYLVRRDPTPLENGRAVCLISEQGYVVHWYQGWESSPDAVEAAIERATSAAVVHSVMSA